jgi:hypothetical protein
MKDRNHPLLPICTIQDGPPSTDTVEKVADQNS